MYQKTRDCLGNLQKQKVKSRMQEVQEQRMCVANKLVETIHQRQDNVRKHINAPQFLQYR